MMISPILVFRFHGLIPLLAAIIAFGIIFDPGCGGKTGPSSSGPDFTPLFAKLSPDIPTARPLVFAPDIISPDSGSVRGVAISPNGDEIIWAALNDSLNRYQLRIIHYDSTEWSLPTAVSFSDEYNDIMPAYAPDGNSLYFASDRPRPGETKAASKHHIWRATRKGGMWAEPEFVSINSDSLDWSPSVTRAGHLYFVTERDGRRGDINRAEYFNSGLITPASLGEPINSIWAEAGVIVDPNERFILFAAADRQKGYGGFDIYISRKSKNGWNEPSLLDARINSPLNETHPFISPDDRYLFFQRDRLYWFSLDSLGILE